jgi:hypothetical protein
VGEVALALILAALTFVVHNVSYMLSHPLWLDEAWVADSTRAPLHLLSWITSSTPLGWTLLLRLVPGDGEQRFRVITLIFSALAVLVAYALGRELRLIRVVTAVLLAAGVLLAPVMLIDDELKQYTAEACASIAVLLLVARVETQWSRSRLVLLSIVSGFALLFTNTAVFVGVAAVVSLGLVGLGQRRWRRLAEVAAAGALMLTIQGIIYLTIDKPHQIPSLASYWDGYYLPHNGGVRGAVSFVHHVGAGVAPYLGFRLFAISLILALGGIATLIWLGRVALALTTPLTIAAVMIASTFRKYPFLDLRTSTFWLVMVVVLMAIGAAGAIRALQSRSVIAAGLAVAVCLGGWCYSTAPYVRSQPLPNEDVRSQVAYFEQNYRPGDILILNFTATWGFAYYDHSLIPTYRYDNTVSVGFIPTYPNLSWMVEMTNRTPASVDAAWNAAQAKAAQHPGARIWIIRSHVQIPEATAWQTVLKGKDATVLNVGPEPLILVNPPTSPPPNT